MPTGNYALPYIFTYPEMCGGLVAVAPAVSDIVPQSRLKALQVLYKFFLINYSKLQIYCNFT